MARPKRTDGDPGAKELLANAFWEMLSERPFKKISVKELSARAGLNHNSFYYHFGNMTDLASYALDTTIPYGMLEIVLPRFVQEGVTDLPLPTEELEPLFQRMKLFAKTDSPELHGIIRQRVEGLWAKSAGTSWEALSAKKRMALSFVSAGAIATLGANQSIDLKGFLDLVNGSMGKIVRVAIQQLVE